MNKQLLIILPVYFLVNLSWAQAADQTIDTDSFLNAVLEMQAKNAQPQEDVSPATPYIHESEKNNSLARGTLYKQGTKVNIRINRESEINYSRHISTSQKNNSLFHGAMAK